MNKTSPLRHANDATPELESLKARIDEQFDNEIKQYLHAEGDGSYIRLTINIFQDIAENYHLTTEQKQSLFSYTSTALKQVGDYHTSKAYNTQTPQTERALHKKAAHDCRQAQKRYQPIYQTRLDIATQTDEELTNLLNAKQN